MCFDFGEGGAGGVHRSDILSSVIIHAFCCSTVHHRCSDKTPGTCATGQTRLHCWSKEHVFVRTLEMTAVATKRQGLGALVLHSGTAMKYSSIPGATFAPSIMWLWGIYIYTPSLVSKANALLQALVEHSLSEPQFASVVYV